MAKVDYEAAPFSSQSWLWRGPLKYFPIGPPLETNHMPGNRKSRLICLSVARHSSALMTIYTNFTPMCARMRLLVDAANQAMFVFNSCWVICSLCVLTHWKYNCFNCSPYIYCFFVLFFNEAIYSRLVGLSCPKVVGINKRNIGFQFCHRSLVMTVRLLCNFTRMEIIAV